MRQFFSRPHPWLMQALGGLIAVIAIVPVAAYVFINVINAKTAAEPAAFAPPPSAQGAAPASPAASSGGGSRASGAAAHPTWADVHAIFARNCVGCHVGASLAGLNLDTYQNALKGGSTSAGGVVNGAVIKSGDAKDSFLWQVVAGKQKPGQGQRMPLGGAPLPQKDIQIIYTWIQQGAKP